MSLAFSLLVTVITMTILSFIGFIADAPTYLIKYVALASFVSGISAFLSIKFIERLDS